MRYMVWLVLAANLTYCKTATPQTDSAVKAFVTHEQASRAFEVIKQIDYLPFSFKADGCYARALYMSMELAAESIPSSMQFIVAKKKFLKFGKIQWRYHVASMLVPTHSPQDAIQPPGYQYFEATSKNLQKVSDAVVVIDPSMYPQPVTLRKWVGSFDLQEAYLVTSAGNFYDPFFPPDEMERVEIICNFKDLPNYQLSHIQRACSVMRLYIEKGEGLDRTMQQQKVSKLLGRTQDLIRILETRQKLDRDVAKFDAQCHFNGL